jgi:hypothetical protein
MVIAMVLIYVYAIRIIMDQSVNIGMNPIATRLSALITHVNALDTIIQCHMSAAVMVFVLKIMNAAATNAFSDQLVMKSIWNATTLRSATT